MFIIFVLNRPIAFICGWYSQSNQLHCLFVNHFNVKWKQISCWINSIRFLRKRETRVPSSKKYLRDISCTLLCVALHNMHFSYVYSNGGHVSHKVYDLVFCVCLLFCGWFCSERSYFISCHNMAFDENYSMPFTAK